MDRIQDFYKYHVEPATEGALIETAGLFLLYGATVYIISRKMKKEQAKEKERIEAEKQKAAKLDYQEKQRLFLDQVKNGYHINLEKLPDDTKLTNSQVLSDMRSTVAKWITSIKSSTLFKQNLQAIISDETVVKRIAEEYGIDESKITASFLEKHIRLQEGIAGWNDSMQICDGTQSERIEMNWLVADIAQMLRYRYGKYISPSTGDGDEGHIYYQL